MAPEPTWSGDPSLVLTLDGPFHYTFETQSIANHFPSWMKLRIDRSSYGQQFLNAVGREFDNIERSYATASGILSISTCDINVPSEIYRTVLPRKLDFTEDDTHTVLGNSLTVTMVEDLDQMFYLVPPTRLTEVGPGLPSGVEFFTEENPIQYDLPHVDAWKEEKPSYIRVYSEDNLVKMDKFFLIGNSTITYASPATYEPVSSVGLTDIDSTPISGVINGYCLAQDYLITLIGSTLRVYDVRVPLRRNTDADWSGNTEYNFIRPLFSGVAVTDASISGLGIDEDRRYFWAKGNDYTQYKLNYDYGIFDYDKKYVYTREDYTTTTVDGVPYSGASSPIWNYFDEWGLKFDTPRLIGESNKDYRDRLLTVFQFRSNSTIQGLVNGISRETDLAYYGWLPQSGYPTNLFDEGIFPSGYPIYPSGNFPVDISGIAKVNPLFDPTFYHTLVDPNTDIASERFVDYTREILETFPILWGSGETDPTSFVWDLAPFDGGANNTNVAPNFFASMTSGVDRIYFQSGVSDPNSQDLLVRLVPISGDKWMPDIHTGNFYIHNDKDYLFATQVTEAIPSGATTYQLASTVYGGPYFVYDPTGTVSASGLEWIQVATLDASPQFEFTVDTSGLVTLNHTHSGLTIRYEGNPTSEWHRLPWDFNPLHGIGYDGFIWISDQRQVINSDGFTLQAIPNSLPIGGSQSLLLGTIIDEDGYPVVGAEVYFSLGIGSNGTISPNNTAVLTQFDGTAIATYNSPATIEDISASGIFVNDSQNPDWGFSSLVTNGWEAYSTVAPVTFGAYLWPANVGSFMTVENDITNWHAVRLQSVEPAPQDAMKITKASSQNGINWSAPAALTIPSTIHLINGVDLGAGNPLVMLHQMGSDQPWALFKGYTYARTWTGLHRTTNGTTWATTWSSFDKFGATRTDGPNGAIFGNYPFNSMVVLRPGESSETLLDLGGCNGGNVWATTTGFTWTSKTSSAPWAPRCRMGVASFQDKVWVIAGNQSYIPFSPYQPDPIEAASAPVHDMWYSEDDGATWSNWGTLPFNWSTGFATVVYGGRLWVIGGVNKLGTSGLILSSEVWSFDGTSWTQHENAPWFPKAYHSAVNLNNSIKLIGGGNPAQMASWTTNCLTGWSMTMPTAASAFFPGTTLGTNFSDMLLYYTKADVSGYPSDVKILLMEQDDSYDMTVNPSGWSQGSDGYYRYPIGGAGYLSDLGDGITDNAHNINLPSLSLGGISLQPIAAASGANWIAYEIDSYSDPKDYGKVNIVASSSGVKAWASSQNVSFDTYSPSRPIGSQVTASGTYLYFNSTLYETETDNISVLSPGEVEVIASGWYEGTPIPPKHATITIGLDPSQQGVLRLDDKFIDKFAYLRWTGL